MPRILRANGIHMQQITVFCNGGASGVGRLPAQRTTRADKPSQQKQLIKGQQARLWRNNAEAHSPPIVIGFIPHETKKIFSFPPSLPAFSLCEHSGRGRARTSNGPFLAMRGQKNARLWHQARQRAARSALIRQEIPSELAFHESFQPQEDASHTENRPVATNGTFPATIQQSSRQTIARLSATRYADIKPLQNMTVPQANKRRRPLSESPP